jgi:pimeloyl-ACP methyl ester carboxylesterase
MKINVNQITLNYEVVGTGEALICLHGNREDLTIFDKLSEVLKKDFTLYLIDSRNHGKSSMTNAFKYEIMRDDIISFISVLGIEKPHMLGFSDGAIIAKLIAIKCPDLLKSIVLLGGNSRPNGMNRKERLLIQEKFRNTKNWYDGMMLKGPYIKKSQLRSILIPTLIIRGSNDIILEKHSKMLHKQIPNSKLIVMQNKNHEDYIIHKDDLYEPLMAFYQDLISID